MATFWRPIVPRLAAVIRVGAMLAFVRVLSPPKVGQSALFAPAEPRAAPPPELRCCPMAMRTEAIIAVVRKQIETSFFIDVLPLSVVNGDKDCIAYRPRLSIAPQN